MSLRGVFSSTYDENGVDKDNAEAWMYYTFYVYRANGTVIRFEFDYTD
jgi:hypothetical protein